MSASVSVAPASESERALPAAGEDERRAFASTFDRLIDSNLRLTASVERLVRTIYVGMGVTAVGVTLALLALRP